MHWQPPPEPKDYADRMAQYQIIRYAMYAAQKTTSQALATILESPITDKLTQHPCAPLLHRLHRILIQYSRALHSTNPVQAELTFRDQLTLMDWTEPTK